jgi:hypothetical protein
LTVTGYDSGTGVISYSYKLNDNTTTHSSATGEDSVFENLAVTLTDVDGDQATGTLSAKIVDDVPTANPDTDSLNNVTQTATGNVISGLGPPRPVRTCRARMAPRSPSSKASPQPTATTAMVSQSPVSTAR